MKKNFLTKKNFFLKFLTCVCKIIANAAQQLAKNKNIVNPKWSRSVGNIKTSRTAIPIGGTCVSWPTVARMCCGHSSEIIIGAITSIPMFTADWPGKLVFFRIFRPEKAQIYSI